MIYKKCTMTIQNNKATLDEDIYLYRLDKNIQLYFTIVNNKYRFDKSDMNNIIMMTNAAFFQVRLYKNAAIKYTFTIQPTDAGQAILTITDDLIDDPIETGDYDFQISLLDEEKTSMISMPIVSKQLHVCEPLVTEDAVTGKALLGLSKTATGEIKNAFDENGNYVREIHSDGEVITSALFNKWEEALETNTKAIKASTGTSYDDTAIKADIQTLKTNQVNLVEDETSMEGIKDNEYPTLTTTNKTLIGSINEVNTQCKDIAKKTIIEDNKIYLAKNDGTKIDSGTKLPSSIISDAQLKSVMRELIADGTLKELSTDSYSSWLAIGDSITVGYNNNNISYADIISEKYGIYLDKDAITGSNMSSDQAQFGNGFYKRIDNDKNDYNLITVMGGLNDFSHATLPLGTFNANIKTTDEPTSFYDGIVILCKKLVKKYPKSKIVFLSSNRDNTYNNKNAESYEQFMEAIDAVCSYFSIPFYRIDDLCGFNRDIYKNQGIDNGDLNNNDMHPKTLGHRKIAGAICDCINFINPVDAWGKGTLNITQLSSIIPKDATISDIKKALTVKILYNNGVEFEITNYDVDGNITEGTSTFTISYRGVTATTTFKTGETSGDGITPSFQLTSSISVDSTTKKVDIGVNPFSEAKATTIKCKFNATLNDNSVGVGLLRCHGTNGNTILGVGINAVGLSSNRVAIAYSNASQVIYNNSSSDYLEFGNETELFLVWDGATTVSVYNVASGAIKWSKIITNVTIKTGEGTFYFGNNHTSRYFTGILTTFNVYDIAFTEQDVLNNI